MLANPVAQYGKNCNKICGLVVIGLYAVSVFPYHSARATNSFGSRLFMQLPSNERRDSHTRQNQRVHKNTSLWIFRSFVYSRIKANGKRVQITQTWSVTNHSSIGLWNMWSFNFYHLVTWTSSFIFESTLSEPGKLGFLSSDALLWAKLLMLWCLLFGTSFDWRSWNFPTKLGLVLSDYENDCRTDWTRMKKAS